MVKSGRGRHGRLRFLGSGLGGDTGVNTTTSYSNRASRPNSNDLLNLWRGFGITPKPGDWSLMRGHIHEVVARTTKAF